MFLAWQVEDKKSILHMIAGTPPDQRTVDPPTNSPKYDELNKAAHRLFASSALYQFAFEGNVAKCLSTLDQFPDAVNKTNTPTCES